MSGYFIITFLIVFLISFLLKRKLQKVSTTNKMKALIQSENKRIEVDSRNGDAYYNRGNIFFDLKNYYIAIKDFDKAIELKSNYPYVFYNRALAKSHLKDYRDSVVDYTIAIELMSESSFLSSPGAHRDIGNVYYQRGITKGIYGDKEGALTDLKEAGKFGYKEAFDLIKKMS